MFSLHFQSVENSHVICNKVIPHVGRNMVPNVFYLLYWLHAEQVTEFHKFWYTVFLLRNIKAVKRGWII